MRNFCCCAINEKPLFQRAKQIRNENLEMKILRVIFVSSSHFSDYFDFLLLIHYFFLTFISPPKKIFFLPKKRQHFHNFRDRILSKAGVRPKERKKEGCKKGLLLPMTMAWFMRS